MAKYVLQLPNSIGLNTQFEENNFLVLISVLIFSWVVCYFFIFMTLYSYLLLEIQKRKTAIDKVLPSFLTLVSANVKAGMTLDRAMWYAAKPEFGVLSSEVQFAIKKSFSGEPLNKSLDYLVNRFNSKLFKRAISLIKQSIISGGELAKVLETTADEARSAQILIKDISSSLTIYVIFILFAAAFGTPLLFGVSENLIRVIEERAPETTGLSPTAMPAGSGYLASFTSSGGLSNIPITSREFSIFSFVMLLVTSFFASLIVGTIQTGNKINGLRIVPFLMVFSLIIYRVVSLFLETLFDSMFI